MQSNLRLWYRTLSGAHQDINKRLHFPHLFVSRPSEILKYVDRLMRLTHHKEVETDAQYNLNGVKHNQNNGYITVIIHMDDAAGI